MLLSARHAGGIIIHPRLQVDLFQGRWHAGEHLLAGQAQILGSESHIVLDDGGHDLVLRVLKDHTDAPPCLPVSLSVDLAALILGVGADRSAHKLDLAVVRCRRARENASQRGFAGAIRSQDAQMFACMHFHGQVVQGPGLPSVIGEGDLAEPGDRCLRIR